MSNFFSPAEPVFTATAPGRLDVMGGIADYSGSLLLQMTIGQLTTVSIQKRNDGVVRLSTLHNKKEETFSIQAAAWQGKSLQESGRLIRSLPGGDWAVYPLGCLLALQHKKKLRTEGLNIRVRSKIPWGKGVSSSAALEVATMHALRKAYQLPFDNQELPILAQMAENLVAGAPCGLMDQLSSHFGVKNKLLPLVCQPAAVYDPVSIPAGIAFSGIDSGIRHAVSGASYTDVRTAAFMAYTIIALKEGFTIKDLDHARTTGSRTRLPYRGYLANIPVEKFEKDYAKEIPEKISGKQFNLKYKISIDPVTGVDEKKVYRPLVCGGHPVYENHRLHLFKSLLENFSRSTTKKETLTRLGSLMLQSHQSYTEVGLGNDQTSKIVTGLMKAGPEQGVFGARVTGGGNGGTVCVLSFGRPGKETIKKIHGEFEKKMKRKLFLFAGSADGARVLNN